MRVAPSTTCTQTTARMPDITHLQQPHALRAPVLGAPGRGRASLYNGAIREGGGAIREGER